MAKGHFGMAVVTASAFNKKGAEADKHGVQNIYLTPSAGKFPLNRNVIAGTVATQQGFEVGKSYLVNITELEKSDEYGRQFSFLVMDTLKGMDLVRTINEIGKLQEVSVEEKVLEDIKTPETVIAD